MATTIEDVKVRVNVENLNRLDDLKNKTESAKLAVNGLASAILGVGFASFINSALQAADRIADFSQATNISIASLKALESAMNQSGGSGKNLEKAINTLYAAIETANNGSLSARDAFDKVGVSLEDLRNASETDILQKTLEGLAAMPPGAERAAIATQLLSRSFRGIDPKQLLEALDTGKYANAEEAIRKAAEANQKLENAFKALQEGAIKAIEPIVHLLGSKELNSDTAAKMITGIGIAFGIAFGASALANIAAVVSMIAKLNIALKATAAAQAFSTALGGPKGLAAVAGATAVAAGAIVGLNKLLGETEAQGQAAADALQGLPVPNIGQTGQLRPATANQGAAARNQELDARQKAVIESQRRIAQSLVEIDKLNALRSASDIEKIQFESASDIAKAREEIFAKENLSRQQQEKEFATKKLEIETRAENDIAKIREDQARNLLQQRQNYADQAANLLGYEKTELQKINDLIDLQPEKYKETGDQLRKNAELQDRNLSILKQFKSVQDFNNRNLEKALQLQFDYHKVLMNEDIEYDRQIALITARDQKERDRINFAAESRKKLLALEFQLADEETRRALIADANGDATAQQSILAQNYYLQLKDIADQEQKANDVRMRQSEQIRQLQSEFSYGWNQAFEAYAASAYNNAEIAKRSFDTFTSGMEDAFVKFAQTGKLEFNDLANSIIADLVRIAVRRAIVFAGSSLFGFPIPGMAKGGPVFPDKPYIVGEQGPELFIPKTAGDIVPNNSLQGGTGGGEIGQSNVTYNINAVDAASFRALVARDPAFIYTVTEQGRRSQPMRTR